MTYQDVQKEIKAKHLAYLKGVGNSSPAEGVGVANYYTGPDGKYYLLTGNCPTPSGNVYWRLEEIDPYEGAPGFYPLLKR